MATRGVHSAADGVLSCSSRATAQACSYPCMWSNEECFPPTIMQHHIHQMVNSLCQEWTFGKDGNLKHEKDRQLLRRLARHADIPLVTPKRGVARKDRTLCRDLRRFLRDTREEVVRIAKALGIEDVLERSIAHTLRELVGHNVTPQQLEQIVGIRIADEKEEEGEGAKGSADKPPPMLTRFSLQELLVASNLIQVADKASLASFLARVPMTELLRVEGASHLINLLRFAQMRRSRTSAGDHSQLRAALQQDGNKISKRPSVALRLVNARDMDAKFSFLELDKERLPKLTALVQEASRLVDDKAFLQNAVKKFAPPSLPPQDHPVALFVVGAPARGKGSVMAELLPRMFGEGTEEKDFAVMNTDDVRDLFPQYNRLIRVANSRKGDLNYADVMAATRIHGYASKTSKHIFASAIQRRVNILYDGAGRIQSMNKKVERLKKAGYLIVVVRVGAPQEIAYPRMVKRGAASGRIVPTEVMLEIEASVMSDVATAFYTSVADFMVEVDNSGATPKATVLVNAAPERFSMT